MNRPLLLLVVMTAWAWEGFCLGEGQATRFELESKAVGVRYSVEVVLPAGASESGLKYPVVYCTDWFMVADYLKALPRIMELGRLTEPFVMVGISQPGNAQDWATARTRDFTPARPTDEYSKRNTFASAMELTGGASRFVAFMRDELIPHIEAHYPVDSARRAFLGYSLGGLLGTYVLKNEPQLFQYYLLGSPSLWFNEYSLAREFDQTPAAQLDSVKKVYLSVGEDESWEMLKGYGILRDTFLAKGLKGARARMEIIEGAGHVSAMPIALYNGLRFLFHRE